MWYGVCCLTAWGNQGEPDYYPGYAVMIDINQFKPLNDTFGHKAGGAFTGHPQLDRILLYSPAPR